MSDQGDYADYFANFYQRVHLYCARRVGWTDADEVTAEIFVQAWQRWPQSQERSLPWLYRTAGLVILNHRRARQHQDRVLSDVIDTFTTNGGPTTAMYPDSADLVLHQAHAATALNALRDEDREILLLSAWDGLSAREIGNVLGCSTPAAYVRLHRARRRLEDLLSEPASVTSSTTTATSASGTDDALGQPTEHSPARRGR